MVPVCTATHLNVVVSQFSFALHVGHVCATQTAATQSSFVLQICVQPPAITQSFWLASQVVPVGQLASEVHEYLGSVHASAPAARRRINEWRMFLPKGCARMGLEREDQRRACCDQHGGTDEERSARLLGALRG